MRPISSALYGVCQDEEQTIASRTERAVSYSIDGVKKHQNAFIDFRYVFSPEHSDRSAVIFSGLATWGKVRAVADNAGTYTIYTTYYPNPDSLVPIIKHAPKAEYGEHLLDGLVWF